MVKIKVNPELGLNEAFIRFKRQIRSANILEDYKKHEFFLNKAEKRRAKQKVNSKKKK